MKKNKFTMKSISFMLIVSMYCAFANAQTKPALNDSINKLDAKFKKQGIWKKYYSNGKMRYEGQFKDDNPYGQFKYYYEEDGKLKTISDFYNNGKSTHTTHYFNTGKIEAKGNYFDNKKDSLWVYYNEAGVKVSEEFYKNNQKNGIWRIFYYDTGTISEETTWKDGVKNGPAKEYYDNGKLKVEKNFLNNLLDGVYHVYDYNGALVGAGKFSKNLKEGLWVTLRPDGTTKVKYNYKAGVLLKMEDLRTPEEKAKEVINDEGKEKSQQKYPDQDKDKSKEIFE